MMKIKMLIFSFLFITVSLLGDVPQCPFQKGFNVTDWFQKGSATQITNWYAKADFEDMLSLGIDHIRLPIHLFNMSGNAPDYALDPVFFTLLDQPVDWCEELGLHLILDNHSFDPAIATDPGILDRLIKVWQQMAEHYKDRSTLIYYEILNEPHGISDATWNTMQQQVIDSIRTIDTTHTLIIGPAGWNSYGNLSQMPEYDDDKLIVTFHFYDPFLFTHQGASWTDPPMTEVENIPYPYDAERMPDMPASLAGTWVGNAYNTYPNDGTKAFIQSKVDMAIQFRDDRQMAVHCGEFGAYMISSTTEDRARWTEDVRTIFEDNDIAWTQWSYAGGFGIFEPGSAEQFDSDLNIPIIEALGLNVPEQVSPEIIPDTTGMVLYDDFVTALVRDAGWAGSSVIDYYHTVDPHEGVHCIYWTDADQYNTIGWRFSPTRDFSTLLSEDFRLVFWMKADATDLRIDVRFIDTDLMDGEDHPWRMTMTVDNTVINLDGTWEQVDMPLADMWETGSWHNDAWYNPEGLFDWTRIDRIEFVAEHHSLEGYDVYLDEIEIAAPESETGVNTEHASLCPGKFMLCPAYPNPFNPVTQIVYQLPFRGHVKLLIYDTTGRLVRSLVDGNLESGEHLVVFDASDLPSGIYLAALRFEHSMRTQKLVLVK